MRSGIRVHCLKYIMITHIIKYLMYYDYSSVKQNVKFEGNSYGIILSMVCVETLFRETSYNSESC